jgi:hypothetical protein
LTLHLADTADFLYAHRALRSGHPAARASIIFHGIFEVDNTPPSLSHTVVHCWYLLVKSRADYSRAMQASFARGMRTVRLSAADLMTEAKMLFQCSKSSLQLRASILLFRVVVATRVLPAGWSVVRPVRYLLASRQRHLCFEYRRSLVGGAAGSYQVPKSCFQKQD